MADVQPLRALHYDLAKVGSLADVAAPPYDVIDPEQRGRLAARSPYNVVRVDLPEGEPDPVRRGREDLRALAGRGRRRARRRARAVDAHAGLHRSRRALGSRATGSSRACAWRTTAPGASAPTSAPTPAPRRTACGSRARPRRTSPPSSASTTTPTGATGAVLRRRRALRRADRRRRHRQPPRARDRPRRDRGLPAGARPRRAAHRRRPPPLRDRARLRRGDRRRGRAPLRAHVPGRAAGRGADGLPHPPPHPRHRRAQTQEALGGHAARALRPSRRSTTPTCARPTARAR